MESLIRSLNYDLQFDKDAQHILESSHSTHTTNAIALTSTPTITSFDTPVVAASGLQHSSTTSDFLSKLGASIINSIQLQTSPLNLPAASSPSGPVIAAENMDFSGLPHQVIIDSHSYDELQKQAEYDQFMNEVWIGIVLILILISMVFCFCSCFLYHQFRVWKRNYRTTISPNEDEENVKISLDLEDPVPEYTLVSGLPSYEAALELLHKNPQSCLIVHPSVFEVFNKCEKSVNTDSSAANALESPTLESLPNSEASTPLLSEASGKSSPFVIAPLPAGTSALSLPHSLATISLVNEKSSKSQSSEKSPKTSDKTPKM